MNTKDRKEMSNRMLNLSPEMRYLADDECYYLQRPQNPFHLAVIGCGMIGMEHIRVTALEGSAVIHGLCDPDQRSLKTATEVFRKSFPGAADPVVYPNAAAAAEDPAVDAVIVCTPNYTHRRVLEEILPSGKPVYLEKPMATTLEDAAAILRMSRQYSSFIQIGLQYRHKSIYTAARREALETDGIGPIKTISMMEHRIPFLDKKGQWNKFSEYSGGTLVEKCCHYFDLSNLFAGMSSAKVAEPEENAEYSKPSQQPGGTEAVRPVSVFSSGSLAVNYGGFSYKNRKADIVDNAVTVVRYSNGTQAVLNLCMFAPLFYEELVLCGERGRLKVSEREDEIEGLTNALELHRGEELPSLYSTPRYPRYIEEHGGHHGSTFFAHRDFVRRLSGEQTESATAEEGFWSIVVGVAAEESLRQGREILVDKLLQETLGTADPLPL